MEYARRAVHSLDAQTVIIIMIIIGGIIMKMNEC